MSDSTRTSTSGVPRTSFRRTSTGVAEVGRRSGSKGKIQFSSFSNDSKAATGATKKDMAEHLAKLEHQFTVTPQRMRMIVDAIVETFERGLEKNKQEVPMLPTFVFNWPTGQEKGSYLAVDLGGTNLRVCHVELEGDGKFEVTQTKYRLTEEQKHSDGQLLFDFCAECLMTFVQDHFADDDGVVRLDEPLPLGFTFSYPCLQDKIDHGVLIRWTKGFGAPNAEGKDCAAMFQEALTKNKVPVTLVALINDTTGTMIASAYVDQSTRAGIIFGTGCNAAYMEKIGNIPKIKDLGLPEDELMAINCEWGAFDSETKEKNLPRTPYDIHIDETSNKPGEQAFEKMVAGLYLGELFRLIMIEMIDDGVLFLGQNTNKVETPYAFDTAFLSLIESDTTDELLTTTGLFNHFFSLDTTIAERQFMKRLAVLIGTRSARLSACGIAAIVAKQGLLEKITSVGDGKWSETIGIATDGSLYNKYPKFPQRLEDGLVDVFGEKGRAIKTYHAEDGSGVGAAVIAAMTKARKEKGLYLHV